MGIRPARRNRVLRLAGTLVGLNITMATLSAHSPHIAKMIDGESVLKKKDA